jgi:NAD(P)-dependent dehydrogenase (short-subunit alcohol dehydrogenase family)
MKKLSKKVCIVTGAAMGLGNGVAKVFAKYGARLALFDIASEVGVAAEEINEAGGEAIAIQVDVTKKDKVAEAVAMVVNRFGHIDCLAAIAGVCRVSPFLETTDKMRDFHISVNICGVWNVCQIVFPEILKNEHAGAAVLMSSVTGDLVADPGEAAYATSKAAIVGLTKALAVEFADRGLRVNTMQLGYARTPLVEGMAADTNPNDPESVIAGIADGVPMGRLCWPSEVGELAAFLVSDESSYITGAQLLIDGGSTLPETVTMGR